MFTTAKNSSLGERQTAAGDQSMVKPPPLSNPLWRSIALRTGTQAKLTVSQPNDPYEQEADRIADHVMQAAESPAGQTSAEDRSPRLLEEIGPIRRTAHPFAAQEATSVADNFASNIGAGEPLNPTTRAFMERGFGYDFSTVRLHKHREASDSANAINARAYTRGRDVVMAREEPSTETADGCR